MHVIFVKNKIRSIFLEGMEPSRHEFDKDKAFTFVIGAMSFARGWPLTPTLPHNRLIFYSVMLGGSLIFWHWEAMLISFLAVRTTVLPFNNIEELVSKTDFKVLQEV